jgi:hypothetical protein
MRLRHKHKQLAMLGGGLLVMFLSACSDLPEKPISPGPIPGPIPKPVPPVPPLPPVPKPASVPKPVPPDSVATIIDIVLDLSGSIKKPQFKQANAAANRVVNLCHERSKLHPGERADFLSVNWFGSHRRYEGTKFINCSNRLEMSVLSSHLDSKKYKPLGDTAIYSAILQAADESLGREKMGTGKYLKVIIVVTDGKDTNSPQEVKRLVRTLFPNPSFFLAVIGVGPKANVSEFKEVADHINNISNFDALAISIMATVELAGIRRR